MCKSAHKPAAAVPVHWVRMASPATEFRSMLHCHKEGLVLLISWCYSKKLQGWGSLPVGRCVVSLSHSGDPIPMPWREPKVLKEWLGNLSF